MPMSLDEFVETEIARLLRFQQTWKGCNVEDAKSYPLTTSSELSWQRFYLGYTARSIERQHGLNKEAA